MSDTFDAALNERYDAVTKDQALDWLSEPQAEKIAAVLPSAISRNFIGDVWRGVQKVNADIDAGVMESPTQMLGGARDAAQSGLDLASFGARKVIKGLNKVGLVSDAKLADVALQRNPTLPEVEEAKSVTGAGLRYLTQFVASYAATGAATGIGGGLAGTATKGAIADFVGFGANQERLSNLLIEVPALKNPVTEFLAADKDDAELEGRFKNALEGLGIGAMAEVILKVARAAKGEAKTAAPKGNRLSTVAPKGDLPREVAAMKLLGDRDAPALELGVTDDVAAKALTDKGLEPLGSGEVYINWNRIDAPEDIKRVLNDTATAFKGGIDESTRGVRTNVETRAAAADLDAFEVLANRRKGAPLNAEQSVAARELWVSAGTKLKAVAEEAAKNPSPENLFEFRRMLAIFDSIQKEVIGARTETARALQSWKIPAGASREQMAAIEDALFAHGGTEVSADLAKAIAKAGDEGGLGAIGKIAERGVYAKTRDAVLELWTNFLLSGLRTHEVNIASNVLVAGLHFVENGVAGVLGRILGREDAVGLGELLTRLSATMGGLKDGFRNAARTARTGETGFGLGKVEGARQRQISSSTWNMRSGSLFSRAVDGVGAVVNIPTRALAAEDEFFKSVHYSASLHAQAYRQVQEEIAKFGLDPALREARLREILADPSEEMRILARDEAAYQTFTSTPGPLVRKLNSLRAEYPLLRFILPFVNTPANIFKFVGERTPLAPVTARYRAAVAKGGREADLARTKMAMGTSVMLLSLDLALNGRVSGSGPSDPAERANLTRQGWKPYSVRIGNKYFAYNRLDPIGTLLGIGADIGEAIANADNLSGEDNAALEETIYAAVFSTAENVLNKTYMSGLSDLIEALNDPDRFAEGFAKKFAGSLFVPKAVQQIAEIKDPVARYAATAVDAIKARIPGLSETLPARRDLWGRPISYQSGIGPVFDALSPIYGSTYKPEPIDAEMQRDGWFLGSPQNAFVIDGERVSLKNEPKIYSRFLELRGATRPSVMGDAGERLLGRFGDRTLLEVLNDVVSGKDERSEEYRSFDNGDDRHDFIQKIVGQYQRVAKGIVFAEFPGLTERAAEVKRQKRALTGPAELSTQGSF